MVSTSLWPEGWYNDVCIYASVGICRVSRLLCSCRVKPLLPVHTHICPLSPFTPPSKHPPSLLQKGLSHLKEQRKGDSPWRKWYGLIETDRLEMAREGGVRKVMEEGEGKD